MYLPNAHLIDPDLYDSQSPVRAFLGSIDGSLIEYTRGEREPEMTFGREFLHMPSDRLEIRLFLPLRHQLFRWNEPQSIEMMMMITMIVATTIAANGHTSNSEFSNGDTAEINCGRLTTALLAIEFILCTLPASSRAPKKTLKRWR